MLHRQILLVFFVLGLCSCASTHFSSFTNEKPEEPFSTIFLVFIESDNNIKEINEETYNQFIKNSFVSFESKTYREHVEKTVKRNVTPYMFPKVTGASEVFDTEEEYSYEDFVTKVMESECQSVLLINIADHWRTSSTSVTHINKDFAFTHNNTEPNFKYYCNLFDAKGLGKCMWTSKIVVKGEDIAGYDTLNNHMARRLSKQLKKDKMIY